MRLHRIFIDQLTYPVLSKADKDHQNKNYTRQDKSAAPDPVPYNAGAGFHGRNHITGILGMKADLYTIAFLHAVEFIPVDRYIHRPVFTVFLVTQYQVIDIDRTRIMVVDARRGFGADGFIPAALYARLPGPTAVSNRARSADPCCQA
jgi:hypothetical protein